MKLKILLPVFVSIFFPQVVKSQTITVKDEATNKPISDIFVYHENKTSISYTGEDGIADISKFPKGLIFVQHPSYYEKSIAYVGSNIDLSLVEKIVTFNEVIISANKWEQEEKSVSQQIIAVNKKSIEFQNPPTTADILSETGQVYVQKSQLGGGSPKLRGFAANSVLLVVDGVRMNNAIFRSGNLQNVISIDANALERTEVMFGPGSVIYGSDALGGVLNFHTIDPKWAADDLPRVEGNFLAKKSSATNERAVHVDVSASKKKFSFFHSSSFTVFDDLKAGSKRSHGYEGEFERTFYAQRIDGQDQLVRNDDVNIQRFSGYRLFNTISKIKLRLGDKWDAGYGYYFSTTSNIPRYDNLTETIGTTDSLKAAQWYYGPQKWQMHNLRLNYYAPNRIFDQARVTFAYQIFEESRNDRDFGDDRLRTRTEKVDMFSASVDLDKEINTSNLYYGFDFFHNDVVSEGFRRDVKTSEITPTSSRYPNGGSHYTSAALYGSLVHNISDKLILNSGLRLNLVNLSASTSDSTALANQASTISLHNSSINGAAGLAWNPTDDYKLSYNLSTGFRSPNIDDVGKLFEVGRSIVVPNANLKPEYSVSNEVAVEKKTDRTLIRLVGFYSNLFDAIVDRPFTIHDAVQLNGLAVFAKVNATKAAIYGGSLVFKTELSESFAIEKTVTWVDGKELVNNQPLRHTTPVFGKVTLVYKQRKYRSEFYINYNGNRGRKNIPSSEIDRKPYLYAATGSPGWYTLNVRASYQLSEYVRVNFGIENILDKHYRPYSSGISALGRNFVIAVKANL